MAIKLSSIQWDQPASQDAGAPDFSKVVWDDDDRSIGTAVADTGRALASGVGTVVEGFGNLYGLATGDMNNAATGLGQSVRDYWSAGLSPQIQAKRAARSRAVAQQDGMLDQFLTAAGETITDPALLIDTTAETAASLLPVAGAGRAASALSFALRGSKPAAAATSTAGKVGTAAAIGTGAAMTGADVSGSLYDRAMDLPDEVWLQSPEFVALAEQVGADQAKHEIALRASRLAFPAAAGLSVASQKLVPGGASIERVLGGAAPQAGTLLQRAGRGAVGALGEGTQEAIEEGGGRAIGNLAMRFNVDPTQEVGEGVGEAAGLGFAGSLGLGGAAGLAQRPVQDGEDLLSGGSVRDQGAPAAPRSPGPVPPVAAESVIGAAPDAADIGALDAALAAARQQDMEAPNAVPGSDPVASSPTAVDGVGAAGGPAAAAPDDAGTALDASIDYTPRLAELRKRADQRTPEETAEYARLLEVDRTTTKVGGKPIFGVQNFTKFEDDKAEGTLKPFVLISDADNFKAINDTYGHQLGDEVIRVLGETLRDAMAEVQADSYHRSGDEFLAAGADADTVRKAAERANELMRDITIEFPMPDGSVRSVTGVQFSYGIGRDETEAEAALHDHKAQRAAQGLRTERGADRRQQPGRREAEAGSVPGELGRGADGRPVAGATPTGETAGSASGTQSLGPRAEPEKYGLPKPLKPRQKKSQPKDFDPNYDDLLDFIALNGGMHREVLAREGVDPAEWTENGRRNQRFIGKPVFKKGRGMTVSDLRERMQEAGFLPEDPVDRPPEVGDDDALQLLMDALGGRVVQTAAGTDVAARIADIEAREAGDQRDAADAGLARELGMAPEALQQELEAADAADLLREFGAEFDPQDEAEALAIADLVRRAYDAGVDPTAVLDITFDAPAAQQARELWALIKEKEASRGPDTEAVPVDREGGPEAVQGGQGRPAAPPAAERQPAEPESEQQPAEPADRQAPGLTLTAPAAPPVATQSAAPASQGGLFAPPTRGEVIEAARREKDAQRNGQNTTARTDMMAGDGELFAGPRPEQLDVEQAARNSQRERITPDVAAGMQPGEIVVDDQGFEYRAHSARQRYLEAHPIVDGRAQVNSDSRVIFHLEPSSASSYPERNPSPIYRTGRNADDGSDGAESLQDALKDAARRSAKAGDGIAAAWYRDAKALGLSVDDAKSSRTWTDAFIDAMAEDDSGGGVQSAAAQAATSPTNDLPEPTEAQKEAGNYKVGRIRLHGLDISIENPAGTRRRPEWPPLAHHYGYIRGTKGKDKDHVDVFLGPGAEDASLPVFVVDQVTKGGKFDEHKVMLGFADEAAARAGYLANYSKGWKGLGGITEMPMEQFKQWVMDPAATKKMAGEQASSLIESEDDKSWREWEENYARVQAAENISDVSTRDIERAMNYAERVLQSNLRRKREGESFDQIVVDGMQNEIDWLRAEWDKRPDRFSRGGASSNKKPKPPKAPSNAADALAGMSEAELSAMFDEIAAETDAVPTELPEKERAKAPPRKKRARPAAHRYDEKTLAAYFEPDRIIKSYGNEWDRVVSFDWNGGIWNVRVIHVNEDGSPVPGERERQHSTRPEQVELTRVLGAPATKAKAPTGAGVMAEREESARQKFIEAVTEQFGLTEAEAFRALAELQRTKLVKLDPVGGQFEMKTGAAWDAEVMRRAARQGAAPAKKPRATRSPAEKIQSEGRSAADMAKSLGVNLSSGGVEALKGLSKLFGGPGRLNSGLTFDEQTYAAAKPHFQAMLRDFQAAGRDVRDLIREMIRLFGSGVKPYLLRFAEELRNAPGSNANLESDRRDAEGGDSVGSAVQADGRGAGPGAGSSSGRDGRGGSSGQSDVRGGPAVAGEQSDQPLDSGERPAADARDSARGDDDRGGDLFGGNGVLPDRAGAGGAAPAADGRGQSDRLARQRAADRIPVRPADAENIRETLPLLLEGQQEDVHKAETRFAQPDGYGMLFTNGTGTGKTFTGLGVVKRFARQGMTNTLILAPDDKVIADWIESAKQLDLDITRLADTKDAGRGIVITTYANLGDNDAVAFREWDLVVTDEAHKLSQNADGNPSQALHVLRAITMHPRGAFRRAEMLNRELLDRAREAADRAKAMRTSDDQRLWFQAEVVEKESSRLYREFEAKRDQVRADVEAAQGSARTRVLMLSATPFAYEFSIDLAEGYLFDYEPPGQNTDSSAYNSGDARERYFVQHFGYRMRYNKLTKPDAKVDSGIMQRQFNAMLKQQGVLSGRMLDVAADYDRRFVLIESRIGQRIDEALQWLWDQSSKKGGRDPDQQQQFRELSDVLRKQFDYLNRRYLLEAIKAEEALKHVREHMALGRKVVVFHDYKKGGGFNPFRFQLADGHPLREAADAFEAEFSDLVNANLHKLPSPVDLFRARIPGALIVNGDQKPRDNLAAYKKFNDDGSGPQVMLVQAAKSAGWSGHDTTGKHQRVLLNLGQPTKPTESIQQEGRIYRTGQVTNAIIRYFNTGTNWERWTFASTIAERASAAENLAMGELARALKDSIIEAFEDSSADYRAGHDGEGTGGKVRDRAAAAAITLWDRAKTLYFGQMKRNSRTKSREGNDYFATPEPLGLKMVEWAEGRAGEAALEPSAGHGAIARWFREDMERTAVEPSTELRSRLALTFGGKQTRIVDGTFEGLNLVNKYDTIVMNPPFGTAGRTAVDHLAKAANHLRPGGRVVALIPTGPSADAKFDRWFYDEDDARGLALVADIRLPGLTFERAGTGVMTRVVVIEKPMPGADVRAQQRNIDLTSVDDINALFDRLENIELAPRSKPVDAEETRAAEPGRPAAAAPAATTEKRAGEEVIEHVTGKGKTIRGIVRMGIDQAQAKELDPYTFRKNGGWFIREKYLSAPDAPRFSRRQRSAGGFLSDEQVRDIAIRQLGADGSNARILVMPFDQLPARIQEHAEAQDAPAEEIHAVHWRGVTYLVSDRFTDPAEVAEAVFHEHYGHFGLRAMYGRELAPELRRLASRVGGLRGAVRLAEKQGIDLTPDIRGALADRSLDDEQRVSLIMEELLTHMAEATGSLRRMIEEAIGAVRDWLRRRGYAELADYGATDLALILRRARQAAQAAPAPASDDDQPRFMRARPARAPVEQSAAVETQAGMLEALGKGQPLDRLIRKPFDVLGMLDSHGRLKPGVRMTEAAERILTSAKFAEGGRMAWANPLLETVRAGLIDRYGLTEGYIQRDAERQADERKIALQAMDIAQRLAGAGVGIEEAKVLQAVLTGEQVAEGDYVKLSEPIRQAVDELGREAVDLGLISPESYERNRGSYLHRVYMKHEAVLEGSRLAKWVSDGLSSRRRKIVGNSFKGRGMDLKVTMAELQRGVPGDWWKTKAEDGRADRALKGQRFIVLDRMAPIGEGTETAPGIEQGGPRKRRTLERVHWPADLALPARFETWENRGEWEVRDVSGSKVVLWRDFTKAERESMGEILDARYTIAKTFQLMAHDLSTARFFKDIALNPEWSAQQEPEGVVIDAAQASRLRTWAGVDWVKVPDITIPKSRAKKYGQLSGKWVRAEIWRDIAELERMNEPGLWQAVMTQWKLNKTARSPVVHMNNVLSNMVFMDMADVRLQDLARGLHAYVRDTQEYRDALEHGAFGSSMISMEIRRTVLEPLLQDILKQNLAAGGVEGRMAVLGKLADRLWTGVKALDDRMTSLYQLEDEVFRMATYMRRITLGDTPAEAAAVARDQFLNYDIRAPWINTLRRTVLPFIGYTYRAVPVIARSISHRPWKLAKYATIAYVANALAYMLAPGDEDEERRSMRPEVQGYTWIGVPRMLRMPWRDEHGMPVFLDIRRWIPAGDVFDTNQGQSALPIPAPIQFGGPLMLGAELALNKQAFTGDPITNELTDTTGEKVEKVASWAWKSWMPGAAWIPGSWYWDKIERAAGGGRDMLGRDYSLAQALASSAGIKLSPQDVAFGMQVHAWQFERTARELKSQARQLGQDKARGLISDADFNREMRNIEAKFGHLGDRARETFSGSEADE